MHTGSALAVALYDHIITFDDEVAYIWRDWDIRLSKAVYVYLRYGTELPLFYVAYGMSHLMSLTFLTLKA